MQARDIMTGTVVTVTAGSIVGDAATLLASHGFTALPLVIVVRPTGVKES
jgi:CBS-domain-containing membrane protein